jgi:hypothetical protein
MFPLEMLACAHLFSIRRCKNAERPKKPFALGRLITPIQKNKDADLDKAWVAGFRNQPVEFFD